MLPNIFWSRTDYISGAYATEMVAISSPDCMYIYTGAVLGWVDIRGLAQRHPYLSEYTLNKIYLSHIG